MPGSDEAESASGRDWSDGETGKTGSFEDFRKPGRESRTVAVIDDDRDGHARLRSEPPEGRLAPDPLENVLSREPVPRHAPCYSGLEGSRYFHDQIAA